MKKILLLCLSASVATFGAWADVDNASVSKTTQSLTVSKVKPRNVANKKKLGKKATMSVNTSDSRIMVKNIKTLTAERAINPRMKAHSLAKAPEGSSFFESFESESLQAAGWALESKGAVTEDTQWGQAGASELGMLGISPADGDKVAIISFNSESIEEWLISPAIAVGDNEQLKFWAYFGPAFFNSMADGKIDWDTYEYIGEPEQIGDLEVYICPEGGEWTKLWSAMDNYKNMSLMDLLAIDQDNWSLSLADYAGKNVRIAFKYWGKDCNTVCVDAVSVAKPSLEGVKILEPLETLYWGVDRSADWASLNLTLSMEPVLAPLTWQNYSDNVDGATYTWTYHDPVINDYATSADESLQVTYRPDFSSEFTRRNNLYYAPALTGSAAGASDGSYTRGYQYLQAGGMPEFMVNDSEGGKKLMTFGLMPYPQNLDKNTVLIVDDDAVGDMALPVFGHNANVDKYWLNYTLNGDEAEEGDEVRLNGFCNMFNAPGKPLVVTGAHALALGKITDQANFRCDIYALTDEFVIDDANILATAYCPAANVLVSEGSANDYLNLIFDFDAPVVLDNVKAPGYVIKVSGFNSDAVSYFVPIQSELPDPNGLCFGYVEKIINLKSFTDGPVQSFMPIAYVEGEHGPCFNSFAINLDAYYPFIDCDTEEVEVPVGSTAEVVLGSYYDGSELDIIAPEGITATAAGRYDSCKLTIGATKETAQGDIIVKSHGVEHKIAVKATNGIHSISADDATIAEVYSLDGRILDPEKVGKGLYIVRRTDGTTSKAILR